MSKLKGSTDSPAFPRVPPMSDRADLLQGTLDLLILKSLRAGPLHGWGLSERIRLLSDDVLQVNQGSGYPPSIAWKNGAM